MRPLITALILAVAAPALADSASSKKELTEDICSALQLATCGRAPYAVCEASDGIPDSELRARWARVDQLCRRYKDRYGAWLDNGCCEVVRRADPAERAAKEARYEESRTAARTLASIHPDQRRPPCEAFLAKFDYWPQECLDADLLPPATRAQAR